MNIENAITELKTLKDVIWKQPRFMGDWKNSTDAINTAIDILTDTVPENLRKTATWFNGINDYTCSACGRSNLILWRSKFCPNCGARMKMEE